MRKRFYHAYKKKSMAQKFLELSNIIHERAVRGSANFIITSTAMANKIKKI